MIVERVSTGLFCVCVSMVLAVFAACGAAGPSSSADVAAMPSDQRPEGTGGNAAQGARCDFGGAADYTCRGGLSCCYGPNYQTTGYGACQAECAEP